jgi:hypothetical protein
LNLSSLPNFSTFFSSSFALEIKWGKRQNQFKTFKRNWSKNWKPI